MKKRPVVNFYELSVKYYIFYEVYGSLGMGEWETKKLSHVLKGPTKEKARKQAEQWLKRMKKKENRQFRLIGQKFVTVETNKIT